MARGLRPPAQRLVALGRALPSRGRAAGGGGSLLGPAAGACTRAVCRRRPLGLPGADRRGSRPLAAWRARRNPFRCGGGSAPGPPDRVAGAGAAALPSRWRALRAVAGRVRAVAPGGRPRLREAALALSAAAPADASSATPRLASVPRSFPHTSPNPSRLPRSPCKARPPLNAARCDQTNSSPAHRALAPTAASLPQQSVSLR